MPISEEDKRESQKDRATVATGKQLKDTYDLIKALKEQREELKKNGEEYGHLDELIPKVEKSTVRLMKTLKEETAELEKQDRTINKLVSGYKKVSEGAAKVAGQLKEGLHTYNDYNLAMQEVVDLSGQFTGKFDKGIQVFEKMRTTLNLTRKEMVEFGKTISDLGSRGLDIEKLTKSVENLQKVHGNVAGRMKFKELSEMKVAPSELKKILEDRDIVAMSKAAGQANVTKGQRYTMGSMASATPRGEASGEAARFEAVGAKIKRVEEDVQTNIAAALQMGIGPEFAGMIVPLTEMNLNIIKLVEQGAGFINWAKGFFTSGAGGAAGSVAGKVATGAVTGTTTGAASTATATGFWSKMGASIADKWGVAKGAVKGGVGTAGAKTAAFLGPKVMQGLKAGGPAGLAGLGFTGAGMGMDWARSNIDVDQSKMSESAWGRENVKLGAKTYLRHAGKFTRALGNVFGQGSLGATAGTAALPGVGTAIGAVGGAASGAVTGYAQEYGAVGAARDAEEDEAEDRLQRQKEREAKEAAQGVKVRESLDAFNVVVSPMADNFSKLSESISEMPDVIAAGVAQSRLAQVQESGDSKAMHEYADKMSKSFQVATSAAGELRDKQMADAERGAQGAEKMAKLERQKDPRSKLAEFYDQQAKNYRTEQERANIRYQEEVKKHSLVGAAEGAMGGYETGKGQRGRELQAATAEFETQFGGTGNVEEMKKIQEKTNAVNKANRDQLADANSIAVAKYTEQLNLHQKDIDSGKLKGKDLEQAQYEVGLMENKLKEQKRIYDIGEKTLKQENQNYNIQQDIAQAMAATETVEFKRSQRQAALAKAQESFARERGAAPGEIGAYAGAQAKEAQTQLSSFMDTFDDRMGKLQEQLKGDVTGPQRMAIEMRIKDLADERVKLESQSLQSRIHAATAEEKQTQELIGVSKRVADIQRDTAAKMGMSWQVQMKYQSESIKLSRAEIDSMTTEIAKMTEEIANTPGADPERQLQLQQRKADLAQKQADMIGNVLGKQRTFMESQIANAFGIGGGTKVSPLVNQRLFGPQVQNQLGQRQAVGVGGVMTFEQQQAQRLRDAGMGIMGGIGGGVPGPGNAPGLPPGVALPGQKKPGAAAGGAAGAQGAQQGAGGLDISGKIEIGLNDNLLETRVIRIVQRNFGLPGGNA